MTHTSRRLLIIFGVFTLCFIALITFFHQRTEQYAIAEAGKLVRDALLTHKAIHGFVNTVSRPEMYRLKNEGLLYDEYFSPKTMSFTYTARTIKEFLNQERVKSGLDEIYFKLASSNPRNEINRANAFESRLLERMNAFELDEYRDVLDEDGERYLYTAMPVEPNKKGCMKCHGDPADAPAEMVALYPGDGGFYEEVGDIRALISIKIPLGGYLKDADDAFRLLALATLFVFVIIYGLIYRFFRRSEQQQRIISEKNRELERLSITDPLTGVLNRLGFTNLAGHAFDSARRYGKPLSLIMLDLDHFKQVNDQFGHRTGDQLLQEVAAAISSRLRAADIFSRIGGEEFAIVSTDPGTADAMCLAEEIRRSIEQRTYVGDKIKITASFGVAELGDSRDLSQLLHRADLALYAAKAGGRNRVSAYTPSPDEEREQGGHIRARHPAVM